MSTRESAAERDHAPSDQADGVNQGLTVLSYLIAGVLVWGGAGWLADRVLGTSFLTPIGIVLGAAAGIYVIIQRFGRLGATATGQQTQTADRKEAPWG